MLTLVHTPLCWKKDDNQEISKLPGTKSYLIQISLDMGIHLFSKEHKRQIKTNLINIDMKGSCT